MKNNLKLLVLLTGLTLLLVLVGDAIGGRQWAIYGLAFGGLINMGAYWFSDKVALKMSGAKPVSQAEAPELHAIVSNLAQSADLPMPSLHVIPSDQPNAFATGRNPQHAAVAVTEGLIQQLNLDELEGVIAHELAHVRNRDILIASVAATIAGAVAMIARFGFFFGGSDDDDGGSPFAFLLGIIVAPIAALIIQMAISRSREYRADEIGAHIAGRPDGLATALRKIEGAAHRLPMRVNPSAAPLFIVNPLRGGGRMMLGLFSTHPPTEERIRRLEAMVGRV